MRETTQEQIPERLGIRPHALRKTAWRYVAIGSALVGGSAVAAWTGFMLVMPLAALGVFLAGMGVFLLREGDAVQILNRAFHCVSVGDVADAELLHRVVARRRLRPGVRRALQLQRALLAIRAGELEAATTACDDALAQPLGWIARAASQQQRLAAHAMRALLLALRGEADASAEDMRLVRETSVVTPEALARVELAEAINLQKAGRRPELRAHLAAHRGLLANYTNTRERALVKGLERMLAATGDSAYRTPAEMEPPRPPDGWIAKVIPGIASFVPAADKSSVTAAHLGTSPALTRAAARERLAQKPSKAKPRGRALKTFVLWVVLIVMFGAVYKLTTAAPVGTAPAPVEATGSLFESSALGVGLSVSVLFLMIGIFGYALWRGDRDSRRLQAGLALRARGDDAGARDAFLVLAESKAPMTCAAARLQLAQLSMRAADPTEAMLFLDAALAPLSPTVQASASDLLVPGILEDRAVVLAAQGKLDDARGALGDLLETHSSYAFTERARRRVALMVSVNDGEYASAAQLRDAEIDLSLDEREDLLLDLAQAVVEARPAYPGEIDRLRALLDGESAERVWLERMAPELLERFDELARPCEGTAQA